MNAVICRRSIVVRMAVFTLGLQGCFATQNTGWIGFRDEEGVITSASDMTFVGSRVIFHSSVVQIGTNGGWTFSGESKPHRVVSIERDHPWWASADREEFRLSQWGARSPEVHLEPLPPTMLDAQPHHDPSDDTCYSVSINTNYGVNFGWMYLTTCEGKLIGPGAANRVALRKYCRWWAYPAMTVAYPFAIAFDTVTFPLQLYAYLNWNHQRTNF